MKLRIGALGLLSAALVNPVGTLAAQVSSDRFEAVLGPDLRILSFDGLPHLKRLRQLAMPAGVALSFGRFRVDLGSAFVSTELSRSDASHHRVDHVTDSQLRAAYTIGRDAVVATLLLNLPTGLRYGSAKDYAVVGAVSPSVLAFPVASYANGFSVTTGVAAAVPTGFWSLGIAGSVRVSSRFTPYADSAGAITYKPGIEARVRAGADGLLGASRVSLGITYSTFGDDQFGTGGTVRGLYRPGPRWLAEAALAAPIGSTLLNLSLWGFHRSPGDSTGASARNRETLGVGEVSLTIPLGRTLSFEPGVSGRLSKPQSGKGRLLGLGAALRIRLSDAVSLSPAARYDTGWIEDGQGARATFRGGQASAFFRIIY
ncbi:MAG TPA: hypothetical protein VGP61_12015 [Gemmatimonadales bacterium]|nr:hypothetical protein [Gemmatimonadales bacterium]